MATKPSLPSGKGTSNKGQIAENTKFAKEFEDIDGGIGGGMGGLQNDIGEKSGFQSSTEDYIVKKGMAYGEAAKLNILPPGMDIEDQPYVDIRAMPLQTYSGGVNFPGDGWQGATDVKEGYGPKGSLA